MLLQLSRMYFSQFLPRRLVPLPPTTTRTSFFLLVPILYPQIEHDLDFYLLVCVCPQDLFGGVQGLFRKHGLSGGFRYERQSGAGVYFHGKFLAIQKHRHSDGV